MTVTSGFTVHVRDLLEPFAAVTVRRMFGGAGIYRDGIMFALIADDVLYLKADAETVPAFEAADAAKFTYETKRGTNSIGYWSLPDEAQDDPAALRRWAGLAWQAALRASAAKRGTKKTR